MLHEKDMLDDLYNVRNMTIKQISKVTGVSVGCVFNTFKRYGIETRTAHKGFEGKKHSEDTKRIMSQKKKGKTLSYETRQKIAEAHTNGGIGHKKITDDGYINIYFPDHPRSHKDGYIREHVLVAECVIGRWLKDDEVVHHINEDKTDNRKENLKVMTRSEHARMHNEQRRNGLSIE